MNIPVKARNEVSEDMKKLSKELKAEAFKHMLDLRHAPLYGQQLDVHDATGDLSDCRKIYFDHARHRIVYRVLPDEENPERVDVIVVGPRDSMEVYEVALRRLDRL